MPSEKKRQKKEEKVANLKRQIASCRRCPLHKTRTLTVPGEGDVDAAIMFIGEAPGRNEDQQGKPFVGRAGAIFDQLLASVKLTRDRIYLCNILKCRPPGNRNPLSSEIQSCVGNLNLQIKTVDPQVIATLGNFATSYIFEKFQLPLQQISAVHGKVFRVSTPQGPKSIVALYHPAVATYNPSQLKVLMEDFQVFKTIFNGT